MQFARLIRECKHLLAALGIIFFLSVSGSSFFFTVCCYVVVYIPGGHVGSSPSGKNLCPLKRALGLPSFGKAVLKALSARLYWQMRIIAALKAEKNLA